MMGQKPPSMDDYPVLRIACVAHEANRAYCRTIGDLSQPSWDDAPDWQQDSAVKGVQFLFDNPAANPADSHQSWLDVKVKDGWTWGPVKDPDKKQHPCMVPYHELPAEQRVKDAIFCGVVRAMLNTGEAA